MVDLRFDAVMSRSLATTTVILLVCLTLVVVGVWVLFVWIGHRIGWPPFFAKLTWIVGSGLTILISVAILLSYLYSPRSYVVNQHAIVVVRPLQSITIPLSEVHEVRPLDPGEFKGTIRTMGSDGLFARIGRFHSPELGNFRMYATNMDDAVLVDATERFVLTPSDRDKFIAEVQSLLNKEEHGDRSAQTGDQEKGT